MRRIISIFEKDLKNGLRNWEILLIVLVPILLSAVYNISFSIKVHSLPKVVVFSPDEEFREVLLSIEKFDEKFKEIKLSESWDDAVALVERGKAHGAIRLPEDFLSRVNAQEKAEIEVVLDETAPTEAAIIRAALKSFIDKYYEVVSPVKLKFKELRGVTPKQSMLPIFLSLTIILIGVSVIPTSLGEEKEKKTLDAVLLTPVSYREIILAKGIWGSFLILINAIALLLLNDGLTGNNGLLVLILLLGIFSIVGIGLFISILSPTQSTASMAGIPVMLVLLVPSMAGTFGDPIRKFLWVLPGYQIVEGIRKAIFFKSGFTEIWVNFLVLFAWTTVFFWINVWALKRHKL